jgi:hypothetical protein
LNSDNSNKAAETAYEPVPGTIGPVPYLVAGMSIMPGLGVILGPVAVIWGLATLKRGGKPVAIIGAVGFCGQALFFSFLLHGIFN